MVGKEVHLKLESKLRRRKSEGEVDGGTETATCGRNMYGLVTGECVETLFVCCFVCYFCLLC